MEEVTPEVHTSVASTEAPSKKLFLIYNHVKVLNVFKLSLVERYHMYVRVFDSNIKELLDE